MNEITTERGQLAHGGCSESWIVRDNGVIIGHIERANKPNQGTFNVYAKGDVFVATFSGLHARFKAVSVFSKV